MLHVPNRAIELFPVDNFVAIVAVVIAAAPNRMAITFGMKDDLVLFSFRVGRGNAVIFV